MMTKIVISPEAQRDLVEIGDYVAFQLHNRSAARKLISNLRKAVFSLRQFPEAGTPLVNDGQNTSFRYLVCGNYMIFYHLSSHSAHIDRVLYGRRNYLKLLLGSQWEDDTEFS